jgi:formate hydrogenlyase subunit 4
MEILLMSGLGLIVSPLTALVLSPLLMGIISRVKAIFAGRKGQPLLQVYFDLHRLLRKGSVYSSTTSWIFRIAPVVIFSTTLAAAAFVPVIPGNPGISFTGDVVVLLYLLGIGRFFLILSALDTGSAFEGMGASREAFFSALAEPVAFVCFLNVMRANGATSLSAVLSSPMAPDSIALVLTALPLFMVLLAENARIPFDDPATHLELTMIHEVMILDNSGRDLALLEYAAALKLWIFSLIIGKIVLPAWVTHPIAQTAVLLAITAAVAGMVGTVESVIARVRLIKVPRLLFGAGVIGLIGFFIGVTGALSR